MLQGKPTKNGTGISILGDYGDLTSLYETVHEIANSLDENNNNTKGQYQLLMNLAYEIRKGYAGERLTEKMTFDGEFKEVPYLGFQCVWTDILIFISVLRHNAAYIPTSKLNQANLYMLEYVVEKALFNYDPEGANVIQDIIRHGIDITYQYSFLQYQALHIKFVSGKSGKKRFRNIPQLIDNHFSDWRQEYKDLVKSFEMSAKNLNCEILDLAFDDFPEIKW
jgi:hypothetical protein